MKVPLPTWFFCNAALVEECGREGSALDNLSGNLLDLDGGSGGRVKLFFSSPAMFGCSMISV